jgi:pyruvate formate lyase activating enzyme
MSLQQIFNLQSSIFNLNTVVRYSSYFELFMVTGYIFDIKRFSIHDGPGIRSTVFLKGCPLACQWCHNPESQAFLPELIYRPERCLACGDCVDACPHGAVELVGSKSQQDWEICQVDGACVMVCFPGAREIIGSEISAVEVVDELKRDRTFYEESGGGVTFSGGEPLSQPDFLEECLRLSKKAGLSTALDTCGIGSWEHLERMLPNLDLVLYDLKILDDDLHQQYTGRSNQEILANFQRLLDSGIEIQVRRPVIPGVNDTEEEILRLGKYLAPENGKIKIELLPYHALSLDKYPRLGRQGGVWEEPSDGQLSRISEQLVGMGFEVGLRG